MPPKSLVVASIISYSSDAMPHTKMNATSNWVGVRVILPVFCKMPILIPHFWFINLDVRK